MVVGGLKPQGEGDHHEDVKEVLGEPGKDEASVILVHAVGHQDGERDVQKVEEDHEAARAPHGRVHVRLEERQEELGGVATAEAVADVDDGESAEEDGGGGASLTAGLDVVIVVPGRPAVLHGGGGARPLVPVWAGLLTADPRRSL